MAAASASDQSVQLRVMVDKERKKVLYAEGGKDFVDVLLSFLTLPLGTIARLVAKQSNIGAVNFGSLSSLYQSVANFDAQYLCKEMLLKPRNSMEPYCKKLKLNIDDTEPVRYYRCPNWDCNRSDNGSWLSTFKYQRCSCGKVMDTEVVPKWSNLENGFVNETSTFIICDDLNVMPNDFENIVSLLQKLGFDKSETIQEQTMNITKKEVIDLLKLSLLSKTPLTDFIFNKKQFDGNPVAESVFDIGKVASSNLGMKMWVKVKRRKSNGEIVFAEVQEDFGNFLFSFLTFPLGGVLHMLGGFPSLGCLNNMYMSMKLLSPERYIISHNLKEKLVKPQIAQQFDLTNQILPIGAAGSLPWYYCHTYLNGHVGCVDLTNRSVYCSNLTANFFVKKIDANVVEKCVRFNFVDPRSSSSKSSSSRGFAKGPSTYMVTGNLVVTPMLYTHAMSYLSRSKVPLFDLEEKVIEIGREEALWILKASLVTANSLTHCLNQFIATVKDPVAV